MNSFKSVFISVWLISLALGALRAGYQLLQNPAHLGWWSVALAMVPGLCFVLWLYGANVARTAHFPRVVLAAAAAAVLMLLVVGETHHEPWMWVAGVGLLGSALYIYWYSHFERPATPNLATGQILPPLSFQRPDGQAFSTANLNKPLLLMFYRGNWCPICMAQITELAKRYAELAALGVEVLLISPQSHKDTQKLAKRFALPLTFLVDYHNTEARRLGLEHKQGLPAGLEVFGYASNTVLPTVIATDASGKILYCDLTANYRIRPEPEAFLSVFRRNAEGA